MDKAPHSFPNRADRPPRRCLSLGTRDGSSAITARRFPGDMRSQLLISSMVLRQPTQLRSTGWTTQIFTAGLSISSSFRTGALMFPAPDAASFESIPQDKPGSHTRTPSERCSSVGFMGGGRFDAHPGPAPPHRPIRCVTLILTSSASSPSARISATRSLRVP